MVRPLPGTSLWDSCWREGCYGYAPRWPIRGSGCCCKHKIHEIVFHEEETFVTPLVTAARKSGNLYICLRRSRKGDVVGILQRCLVRGKLEWLGYRVVKKVWWYVKPFRYDTAMWQTHKRTDRRTELLYQYSALSSLRWRAIKMKEKQQLEVVFLANALDACRPKILQFGTFCTDGCSFLQLCSKFGSSIVTHYMEMLAFYEIQYGHRPPSWNCWRKSWDHPSRPVHGGYPM